MVSRIRMASSSVRLWREHRQRPTSTTPSQRIASCTRCTTRPQQTAPRSRCRVPEHSVVDLTADETYELRATVLRVDTPSRAVKFPEDETPGTVHLGIRDARRVIAISTWIPKPYEAEPAVQLRGMATAPDLQGQGLGALLLEAGCRRASDAVSLVWARA